MVLTLIQKSHRLNRLTNLTNLSGSDWQTEKQGHWNEIPDTYSIYHKKPSKVKKLIELIRDKEDRAEVN